MPNKRELWLRQRANLGKATDAELEELLTDYNCILPPPPVEPAAPAAPTALPPAPEEPVVPDEPVFDPT